MRKRILAMCLVISMQMAMLCGCGKTETTAYSGKTDTKADKGMAVMGENVTYDPNHLVNDESRWSWTGGYGMLQSYLEVLQKSTKRSIQM